MFLLLLLSSLTFADEAGVWGDPLTRQGEGISLHTRGETLVFFFYTYIDANADTLPGPSPAPPDIIGQCVNSSTWLMAVSNNFDGQSAFGDVYFAKPFDYPNVDINEETLEKLYVVAQFFIERVPGGWQVSFGTTGLLPPGMFLFNHLFVFNNQII